MDKKEAREQIAAKRQRMDQKYLQLANAYLTQQLTEFEPLFQADCVMAYASMPLEPDTAILIARILREKKLLALPCCGKEKSMKAIRIHSMEELRPGTMGILEPQEDGEEIKRSQFDLIVVPCVSCDRAGRRLGHGGGYYDRYLNDTRALKVALCFEQLLLDEVPVEEHDVLMDYVITENHIYDCRKFMEDQQGSFETL